MAPEQLSFDFVDTVYEEGKDPHTVPVTQATKALQTVSVTVSKHPRGYAVKAQGAVDTIVFPHLGTALAEVKRILG